MDGESYEQAVTRHKDRMHTLAAWMLGDVEEAGDIAQMALTRLWEHRRTVHEAAAGVWLRRTAHRLCLDRLRRRVERNGAHVERLLNAATGDDEASRGAEARELRSKVGRALASLGPRDRAVIVLREMDGLSYEQMSEVLSLPVGTLKAAVHRARERLRRSLVGAGVKG